MLRRFAFLLLCAAGVGFGSQPWAARWIDTPGAPFEDYGVYHFRHTFELAEKPEHFTVYVSGDNRYQLFVNGKRVAVGPARGDLDHWRYETVDIGPELTAGRNLLAAVVWNEGRYRAMAQISNRTAFLLQAADPTNAVVNTGRRWKCVQDKAYSPQPLPPTEATGYYALGPNEALDGRAYPWGWEQPEFDDSSWSVAEEIGRGAPRDMQDAPNRWMLVPDLLPPEEQRVENAMQVRAAEGIASDHGTIPPHTTARLLLDQRYLTTAYPELMLSGGRDTFLSIHYAETLYSSDSSPHKLSKGNRAEIRGKRFLGPFDTFTADGGANRIYRPLFWRTFRYIELDVRTADQPLTLEGMRATFAAYPFEKQADFQVNDRAANEEVQKILNTGWRTARLCAHETYMDCPFYEQLQYAGDARIQMLVSLYMTGDARLMKNGIALLNSSRTAEGATYSRAPSHMQQYIPPFSLWWIGMVHDYWMYVDDPAFVKEMLPGVRAVLSFYAQYQKANGSLSHMPWWNFVDWVKQWPSGVPPGNADGGSAAALDLQLALAYGWAADLETHLGSGALGTEYERAAKTLREGVAATDWDEHAGLFADQPEHRTYSEQVNTLAVLAHVLPEAESRKIVEKLLISMAGGNTGPELAKSSIYFRAYANAALREVGLGDRYLSVLEPWREMLNDGLTTWAEWNGPDARSDCHAWGASPNFELLRTIAGIDSAGPGFRRVRIAPNPGRFTRVSATMPHPKGLIRVELRQSSTLAADIELPPGVDGEFDWHDQHVPLHAGKNHLE